MRREAISVASLLKSPARALACGGLALLLAVEPACLPATLALAQGAGSEEAALAGVDGSECDDSVDADVDVDAVAEEGEVPASDAETADDITPVIGDAAVRDDAADVETTEDPVAQMEALGINTDPNAAEGYDVSADSEPEEGADAPTSDDEDIALQSSGSSVRVGDWSYRTFYHDTENKQPYYAVDGYYGSNSSITLPSVLEGKQITCVTFLTNKLPSTVTSVKIPACITSINNSAFIYTSVEKVAFEGDSQLSYIGDNAFYGTPLTEFTMPAHLKTVSIGAFAHSGIKKLILNTELDPMVYKTPTGSDSGKENVVEHFNPCYSCMNVEYVVPSGCTNYRVEGGALLSKDGTILYAQQTNFQGGIYTVPKSVKVLGYGSMVDNSSFSDIVLPEGITTLEEDCLSGTAISKLDMPNSVTKIGRYACYRCYGLTSVTLSSNLRVLNNCCFASTRLTSVNLPPNLEQINYAAFGNISTLKSVTGGAGLRYIYSCAFQNAGITSFPFGKNLKFVSNKAFVGCKFTPSYPSYMDEQSDGYYVYDGTLAVRGDKSYSMAWQVLDLVNQERAKKGLSALTMDKDLLDAAMLRAAETSICFDHARPTGQSCFTASSKMTRENIASGQRTAQAVMNWWMNSAGHQANILSSDTKSIGIGCVKVSGLYYWAQCFGTASASAASRPSDGSNVVMKVNYMSSGLSSFGSRFEICATAGSFISGHANVLNVGESRRLTLYTFPWSDNSSVRTLIDDSCITWSVSGSVAKLSGSTMTGTGSGAYTLKVSIGGGSIEKFLTGLVGVVMTRLYNRWSGEHLYTSDSAEIKKCVSLGWRNEGMAWVAPSKSNTPVYRLYNKYSGDHHYTTSAKEYDACAKAGWTKEGVAWYSADVKTGAPLYRGYNRYVTVGTHHYTTDWNEMTTMKKNGWSYEGIAWYGLQ